MMDNVNYIYFINHLDELLKQYEGKFLVIKDESVIGIYETFDEAYDKTAETEELGTFIIQPCIDEDSDTYTFLSGNVTFA